MEYRRILALDDALWGLETAYKEEIGEDQPTNQDRAKLEEAIEKERIRFYGAWDGESMLGMCSVTTGFSTFNYASSGVLEDFYIRPQYRHKGIARELVNLAYRDSGVGSLTVGCADCNLPMYESLGFSVHLGNLPAFDG